MHAYDIPRSPHPHWNDFRQQVIQAMVDLEIDLYQRNTGMPKEGKFDTIAEQLGIEMNDMEEYSYVEQIFSGLLIIAKERIRMVREENGGQWPVFRTGVRVEEKPVPKSKPGKPARPPRTSEQLSLDLPDSDDDWAPNDERNLLNWL